MAKPPPPQPQPQWAQDPSGQWHMIQPPPPPPPAAKKSSSNAGCLFGVILIIIIIVLVALQPGSGTKTNSDSNSLACGHFRNVSKDAFDGILTDAELRQKLKEIDDDAVIGTVEVEAAARAMLAAATRHDTVALKKAVTDMDKACAATGR